MKDWDCVVCFLVSACVALIWYAPWFCLAVIGVLAAVLGGIFVCVSLYGMMLYACGAFARLAKAFGSDTGHRS